MKTETTTRHDLPNVDHYGGSGILRRASAREGFAVLRGQSGVFWEWARMADGS